MTEPGTLGTVGTLGSYDASKAERSLAAASGLGRLLHARVEGVERVPQGPALVVSNHAFGWDVAIPMASLAAHSGRRVWFLGEHLWWRVPYLRDLAAASGVVDGTRENARHLLEQGELVAVLPGGLREALKPEQLAYRLLWGSRAGFARVAIASGAAVVPLASIGADDVFRLVGNAFLRGDRWFGHHTLPIPRLRLPHRTHLAYIFGEPIVPRVGPELADDPVEARRLVHEVRGALDEILTCELAARAGVDVAR
jgi:1-acyl-sn-glycerol-3-phosphate acyltransferase